MCSSNVVDVACLCAMGEWSTSQPFQKLSRWTVLFGVLDWVGCHVQNRFETGGHGVVWTISWWAPSDWCLVLLLLSSTGRRALSIGWWRASQAYSTGYGSNAAMSVTCFFAQSAVVWRRSHVSYTIFWSRRQRARSAGHRTCPTRQTIGLWEGLRGCSSRMAGCTPPPLFVLWAVECCEDVGHLVPCFIPDAKSLMFSWKYGESSDSGSQQVCPNVWPTEEAVVWTPYDEKGYLALQPEGTVPTDNMSVTKVHQVKNIWITPRKPSTEMHNAADKGRQRREHRYEHGREIEREASWGGTHHNVCMYVAIGDALVSSDHTGVSDSLQRFEVWRSLPPKTWTTSHCPVTSMVAIAPLQVIGDAARGGRMTCESAQASSVSSAPHYPTHPVGDCLEKSCWKRQTLRQWRSPSLDGRFARFMMCLVGRGSPTAERTVSGIQRCWWTVHQGTHVSEGMLTNAVERVGPHVLSCASPHLPLHSKPLVFSLYIGGNDCSVCGKHFYPGCEGDLAPCYCGLPAPLVSSYRFLRASCDEFGQAGVLLSVTTIFFWFGSLIRQGQLIQHDAAMRALGFVDTETPDVWRFPADEVSWKVLRNALDTLSKALDKEVQTWHGSERGGATAFQHLSSDSRSGGAAALPFPGLYSVSGHRTVCGCSD